MQNDGSSRPPDRSDGNGQETSLFIAGFAIFATAVLVLVLILRMGADGSASAVFTGVSRIPTATVPAEFDETPVIDVTGQPLEGGAEVIGPAPDAIATTAAKVYGEQRVRAAATPAPATRGEAPPPPRAPAQDNATIADMMIVGAIVQLQHALFLNGDYETLYRTLAPEDRDGCAFAQFRARREGSDRRLAGSEIRDLGVQIDGNIAYVTYRIVRGANVLARATDEQPDVFLRVNGNWYHAISPNTPC